MIAAILSFPARPGLYTRSPCSIRKVEKWPGCEKPGRRAGMQYAGNWTVENPLRRVHPAPKTARAVITMRGTRREREAAIGEHENCFAVVVKSSDALLRIHSYPTMPA